MNRDDRVALLVTQYIPDSLRLSTNKDAQLVSSALTVLIGAMHDSERMTLKGMASDGRNALEAWESTIFRDHVAAEESDYASLTDKASRAMPVVSDVSWDAIEDPVSVVGVYTFSDTREQGKREALVSATATDGVDSYHVRVRRDPTFKGTGATPSEAFRNAVANSGAMVKGDVP